MAAGAAPPPGAARAAGDGAAAAAAGASPLQPLGPAAAACEKVPVSDTLSALASSHSASASTGAICSLSGGLSLPAAAHWPLARTRCTHRCAFKTSVLQHAALALRQGGARRACGRQLHERAARRPQRAGGRAGLRRRGRGRRARGVRVSLQRLEEHVELAADVRVRALAARRHRALKNCAAQAQQHTPVCDCGPGICLPWLRPRRGQPARARPAGSTGREVRTLAAATPVHAEAAMLLPHQRGPSLPGQGCRLGG